MWLHSGGALCFQESGTIDILPLRSKDVRPFDIPII